MPDQAYYRVHHSAQTRGPLPLDEIESYAASGALPRSSEFSTDGVAWRPLDEIGHDDHGGVATGIATAAPPSATVAVAAKPLRPKTKRVVTNAGGVVQRSSQAVAKTGRGVMHAVQNLNSTVERLEALAAERADDGERCTVFISYRRGKGAEIARWLLDRLDESEHRAYLDVESVRHGDWREGVREKISEASSFIPIITDGFFDRCDDPQDIVRQEVAQALAEGKNIVPLLATENPFPPDLPEDLAGVASMNGVPYNHEHAPRVFSRLSEMLVDPASSWSQLERGEAGPQRVLLAVAIAIGLLGGAGSYWQAAYMSWNPLMFLQQIPSHLAQTAFFAGAMLTPMALLVHAFVLSLTGTSPERCYGGKKWWAVWLTFAPMVAIVAALVSMVVTAVASATSSAAALVTPDSLEASSGWFVQSALFGLAIASSAGAAYLAARLAIKAKAWKIAGRNFGIGS